MLLTGLTLVAAVVTGAAGSADEHGPKARRAIPEERAQFSAYPILGNGLALRIRVAAREPVEIGIGITDAAANEGTGFKAQLE